MAEQIINDGFYQVIIDNAAYTFRIYTHKPDAKTYPGKQIIAIAKNRKSRTFTNFGIIQDGSIMHQFVWWSREEYNNGVIAAAKRLLEGDMDAAGRVYGRSFGRCYVCNRELTDPNSLATGIGPDCASERAHVELGGTATALGDDQGEPLEALVKPEYRPHVKKIYSVGIERGYYYVDFDEPWYYEDKNVKKAFALLRKAVKAYKRRFYHEDNYLEHFRNVRTTGREWFLSHDLLCFLESWLDFPAPLQTLIAQADQVAFQRAQDEKARQFKWVSPDVRKAMLVMGVSAFVTLEDVKAKYRTLAKQYHPDTGGDEEQFKKINNANEVLMQHFS